LGDIFWLTDPAKGRIVIHRTQVIHLAASGDGARKTHAHICFH
jgi:hypothetical protein